MIRRAYEPSKFIPLWDKTWVAYKAGHLTIRETHGQGVLYLRASLVEARS